MSISYTEQDINEMVDYMINPTENRTSIIGNLVGKTIKFDLSSISQNQELLSYVQKTMAMLQKIGIPVIEGSGKRRRRNGVCKIF